MLFVKNSVKRILGVVLASIYLLLPACSLHTIGEVNQLTESHLRKIHLPEAHSRNEQLFKQTLERQIGTADTDTNYQLSYNLTGASQSSLSASGTSSNLKNTKMSLRYSLRDNETGGELTSGLVSATATSGTITSYYGQDVSAQFAAERLVGLLAERMYQRLQLYFLAAEN
tara:strand:- start:955 stop:1467 length:513 start_codon:yes stop_codon:yes gene_type:complete